MNIVLFEESELQSAFSANDPRVIHVREVLSIGDGQLFDAGIINGMRGKACFRSKASATDDETIIVEFEATAAASPLYNIDVVIGMSRPQTCRFVLRSLATLGVRSIEFAATEKGQRSYASSQLWTSGEHLEIVKTAVAQSFETNLPSVRSNRTLAAAVETHASGNVAKICLDNYEATCSLADAEKNRSPDATNKPTVTCLLIGPERGWSEGERKLILASGFTLASIGSRVLRVETAAVAAVSVLLANKFWIGESGTSSTRS